MLLGGRIRPLASSLAAGLILAMILCLNCMIVIVLSYTITMVVIMKLGVVMKRLVVFHRWGQPGAQGRCRTLRLPNRRPATAAIAAFVNGGGFGAASGRSVWGVDGVAAPITVDTLRNVGDD
jgi:hypothetical protein